MKIVSRKQLMALPPGTVYHDWEPCNWGTMKIKRDTIPVEDGYSGDWWLVLVPQLDVDDFGQEVEVTDLMVANGTSHAVDLVVPQRDGCFDHEQMYAVWERSDVEALIKVLQSGLAQ